MCPCVLTLLLLGVAGALAYLYLAWNLNYWKKRGVKGPEPELFYGNLPSIIKHTRHVAFEIQELYEKYKKSGERFIGIFMSRQPEIMVIDPKLAREVLITNFNSFRKNESSLWPDWKVEKISVTSPFFTSAEQWKDRRSDVVGGLSPSKLKSAYPIVRQACEKMIKHLNDTIATKGNIIESKAVSYNFTLEIMADFLWGVSANSFNTAPKANALLNMAQDWLQKSFQAVSFYYFTKFAPIILAIRRPRLFIEKVDNFFSQLQKDAVKMRTQNKTDRSDFLNYIIQLQEKKGIGHWDMVGYSLTVLLDGYETSALVIYHTLLYLAMNQAAQTKLREEILASIDEDGEIPYDTLIELPYLNQCINETIRLIAPIPLFSRICTERTSIENRPGHSVTIDPGTILHIPTYALHHDADTFPNPDEYIPERFDGSRAKDLTQEGRFFPFGDGPRICAGMRLGQLQGKAGVFEIVRNFQLNSTGDAIPKVIDSSAFIIGLAGDLNIEFKPLTK